MSDCLPLQLLLATFAGWGNRRQAQVIDYLVGENRVLNDQLACPVISRSLGRRAGPGVSSGTGRGCSPAREPYVRRVRYRSARGSFVIWTPIPIRSGLLSPADWPAARLPERLDVVVRPSLSTPAAPLIEARSAGTTPNTRGAT